MGQLGANTTLQNTTRRKRKDYFADGSNVYIEQWLVVGGDAAKTEWRRRLLCKGGTVWQVAEMDKVLASRAREAGIHVPHEVEEAAMDRVVFRASADKLDLTRDDDEPVIPRQLVSMANNRGLGLLLTSCRSDRSSKTNLLRKMPVERILRRPRYARILGLLLPS